MNLLVERHFNTVNIKYMYQKVFVFFKTIVFLKTISFDQIKYYDIFCFVLEVNGFIW